MHHEQIQFSLTDTAAHVIMAIKCDCISTSKYPDQYLKALSNLQSNIWAEKSTISFSDP